MGKASSAKKVARAARTGGARKRDRPKLAFPLTIFVVFVAGLLLVFTTRTAHLETADAQPPSAAKKDHWHAAYGLYVCDHFLPPLTDVKEDKLGIHTHGEGIIHIHPFTAAASGVKAQMKVFADQVGLTLSDDGFKLPDGTEYKAGFDCKGKPGKFAVYRWRVDEPTAPIDVYEQNINRITFTEDRFAYTLAILPEGGEPPPMPDSVAELDKLSDVSGSSATGSPGAQSGGDPSVSIPGAGGAGGIDPSVSIPAAGDPSVSTPTVSIPAVSTPEVTVPAVSTPTAPTP